MKNYIKRATVILSLVMAMSVPVNVHAEEYSGEPTEEGVYIAITGETEDFYSNEDIYNASISMYDSEALALYNQYLEQAPASISEGEDFAVAALEGFTQYAVEEGIIEDTVEQRAAITIHYRISPVIYLMFPQRIWQNRLRVQQSAQR